MPSFHYVYSLQLLSLSEQFLNLNVLPYDIMVFDPKNIQWNMASSGNMEAYLIMFRNNIHENEGGIWKWILRRTPLPLLSSVLSLRNCDLFKAGFASSHFPLLRSAVWPWSGVHLLPRTLPSSSDHGCSRPISSRSHLFSSNSPNRKHIVHSLTYHIYLQV